ncbi:MAG: rRNA pseudouridine synthase [Defluviitaleaceae bacterium]|nr:rRNA pseudouridine synthase [Defluviitaleaceae bacterium]
MRLQKFMALNGVASRRKSEELILSGKVSVNGVIIAELGHKIEGSTDKVVVNGEVIASSKNPKVYYMLNKPVGYISTAKDQFGRPTVVSLIDTETDIRLYPIGRLDYDTEGLLILTNDGTLTNRLTHPKYSVGKEYEAMVKGRISLEAINAVKTGIDIGGYITKPAKIEIISQFADYAIIKITIKEGKNRQVRKMCDKIGHPVRSLKRVAIGSLKLGNLKPGQYRKLTVDEIKKL